MSHFDYIYTPDLIFADETLAWRYKEWLESQERIKVLMASLQPPPPRATIREQQPTNSMTSANKSRADQAKQTLTALRTELASASADDQKQPAFVENKKQLDAAIKALDAVKATGG